MSDQHPDNLFADEAQEAGARQYSSRVSKKPKFNRRRAAKVDMRDIQVTREDIDQAMKADSHSCMIADAIKRANPNFSKVAVDVATIRWTDNELERRVMCLTPIICQQKLAAFDYGIPVGPFSFSLRSTQVTTKAKRAFKRDASGERIPVLDENGVQRKHPHLGKLWKSERVEQPSSVPERVHTAGKTDPSGVHIVGGVLPPMNRASRFRKFGVRGFTWETGEDPEAIKARQEKAYGRKLDAEQSEHPTAPNGAVGCLPVSSNDI